MTTATSETIHNVYMFHGPNEPVKRGVCKAWRHRGKKTGLHIFGTVNGERACGPCCDDVSAATLRAIRPVGRD